MKMREKMSDTGFKMMQCTMKLVDLIHPHIPQQVASFGVKEGMTVIDYGCGPGRYTEEFARLVGTGGKVLAVDLVEIALDETQKRVARHGYQNVLTYLAQGYESGVPARIADIVFAIDMFHYIQDPPEFLGELCRIAKDDGVLILSGGHESRATMKQKLAQSPVWEIEEEKKEFVRCRKTVQ